MTAFLAPHVSLNVSDVHASVDFYRRLFGAEPSKQRPGYAKFNLAAPALNLALNQVPGAAAPSAGRLSHLGLQVATTADVLAVRDRWQAAGLTPRDEMGTTCCYATQDKAWASDPDGNEWEVFTVLADAETSDAGGCCATAAPGAEGETAAACC